MSASCSVKDGNVAEDVSASTISVLMSVHDDAKYVGQAVESILNQSYGRFEFLITNDCSSDGSRDILAHYAEQDERIFLIDNEENIGLTKSLNRMIERARGPYLARMDADDIAMPDRFRRQIEVFRREPETGVVFGDTVLIDKSGAEICQSWRPDEKTILRVLPNRCYIPHPTVMMRKETVEALGGYNEECWTGQDKDLWLRMRAAEVQFRYLKSVLLKYRINPDSVRGHSSENYWFAVANRCIWNRQKFKALHYINHLDTHHKIIILTKLMLPNIFYYYRQVGSS
jgi:glycosyltransferase involved in cell wall biosynthesis